MKKLIGSLLVLFTTLLLFTTLNKLTAQVKDGDYLTVKINGSNTYDVQINGKTYPCFRHGKLASNFVFYIDPAKGWTYADPKATVTYTKLDMPNIGEEIYVIDGMGKAVKGKLKQLGADQYDDYKLFIKAEVKNGGGQMETQQFNHYATTTEIAQLGWPLGNPQILDADLRKMEAEIYATIIKARENPAAFSGSLAAYGTTDPVVKEAMAFLNNISGHSFKLLHRKNGMDMAAREHAAEYAANSSVGHKGSSADCSSRSDYLSCRLGRHGTVSGLTGENIFGGSSVVPGTGIVKALILDHGVTSRGHRAAFFDTYGDNLSANKTNIDKYMCAYEAIGIGCIYDKKSGNIACVMDFADGYK